MPSGADKLRFSVHSNLVLYFVIYCGFHHHRLHASFAVKLIFSNKYVICKKYPPVYNPSSLQMQHQYFIFKNKYLKNRHFSNLGMNPLLEAGRQEVGCPDHVWILGGLEWKAKINEPVLGEKVGEMPTAYDIALKDLRIRPSFIGILFGDPVRRTVELFGCVELYGQC